MKSTLPTALTLLLAYFALAALANADPLAAAIDGAHRTPAFQERDVYRHPGATLQFFGAQPDMTVVEFWPGGWYAEILAPYLKNEGTYYAAGYALSARRTPEWRKDMARELARKFEAQTEVYEKAIVTELSEPERTAIAPAGSTDMVLTFRNVHNWMNGDYDAEMFEVMYRALKTGGILGVVEHRAKPGTSVADMKRSGYVTEAHVVRLAEAAGFELVAKSDINANPADTKDHPRGVCTLPPTLRLGAVDREKYLAIGESDRFTLKFVN